MPNIKLSDGRWIDQKYRCSTCKNGEFYLTKPRKIIKHLGADMYKEIWKCDVCGEISSRHWTK